MGIQRATWTVATGAAMVAAALFAWRTLHVESRAEAPAAPLGRDVAAASVDRAPPGLETPYDPALLDPGSPAEARRLLAFTAAATSLDIPRLRDLALCSPNALAAGNALRALGRLGAVAARDDELLALLDDPRPRIRQELVMALGIGGDHQAVDTLARVLGTVDATLRTLAIQSLGRVGGPRATSILQRLLAAPGATSVERVFARQALASAVLADAASASRTPARSRR